MRHTRNLIIILAVAVMLVASAAVMAVAQDSTKVATESKLTDSAKALIQKDVPAPKPAEAGATAGDAATTAEDAATEVEDEATKVEDAAEEATTPAATEEGDKPAEAIEAATEKESEPVTKPYETGTGDADPKAPYTNVAFEKDAKPIVIMETSMGTMTIELWPDIAPAHCQSFVHLINKGFYDSLTFHRVVPGFVIQGGDPLGNGTGGPGYNVPAEFSNKPHEDGVLSMARSQSPNSAGSQFFICLGRLTSLDNKYTVFGKVIEGLEVAHDVEKTPTQRERPTTPVTMTKVYVKAAE